MPNVTGNDLVTAFRGFEWVNYLWGGASPGTGWDCSGAINWVVGERFLLAIPGYSPGQWTSGQGHGPVVQDWAQWIGVTRGGFGQVTPEPGDLVAWLPNVHMGMAINGTRFVSAANPSLGTIEADIGSFFPFYPVVLRLLQIRTGAALATIPRPPGPGPDDYSPTIRRTAQQVASAGKSGYNAAVAIRNLRMKG
jgi:cell wall-associated NlpC family hydrolase